MRTLFVPQLHVVILLTKVVVAVAAAAAVVDICALLRCYAASSGNPLPTFRHNISVPSSSVKNSNGLHLTSCPLKMGPIRCPETSVKHYHSTLRNTPEERRSHQHRDVSLKSRTAAVFVCSVFALSSSTSLQLRHVRRSLSRNLCQHWRRLMNATVRQ
jgi:hypothetical protein